VIVDDHEPFDVLAKLLRRDEAGLVQDASARDAGPNVSTGSATKVGWGTNGSALGGVFSSNVPPRPTHIQVVQRDMKFRLDFWMLLHDLFIRSSDSRRRRVMCGKWARRA
jgi:hypothetical protein